MDTTERLHFHPSLSCLGEGNGNPLQCSCLENPRERGAWWAAVYGVAQSRTRLKRLSSTPALAVQRHYLCWWCPLLVTVRISTLFKQRSTSLGASQVALEVKSLPGSAGDARDEGLIPGSGRSPGGGHGNPLEYSCLENPMERRSWWAASPQGRQEITEVT